MNSIVLAGGRSSRFGRNKLLESVAGRPLLVRVLDVLGQVSDRTILVIAQNQNPAVPNAAPVSQVEVDIYPGRGALGGVYTGVLASESLHNLVVGADMPFLNVSFLRYLMSLAPGFDVVMPSLDDDIEPLHAIYSRTCLEPMRQQIEQGDLTIRHFLNQVKVRYVKRHEIIPLDPQCLSFFNVNTESDLRQAEALAASQDVQAQTKSGREHLS